jgi:hypothetical protein
VALDSKFIRFVPRRYRMAEQKTIYLIRHGQSLHNALENDWLASSPASDQFPDPMCFDATFVKRVGF